VIDVALLLSAWLLGAHVGGQPATPPDYERLPYAPLGYICRRASAPPAIDGRLSDAAWAGAAWTEPFVDIEGPIRAAPRFRTRAKMLWDDDYFYVAAEMEEPDVWGTLTERDAVIFQDNDFEVFIDPDGDTHAYYELEVNALQTPWDLFLPKPYRDGGPALHAWDIAGLKVGVSVAGTLNRPGDRDEGWSVEIAMPWSILREAAPRRRRPEPGDRWRVNFSRVEWDTEVVNGRYVKRLKPGTKDPLPEHNWVWSPQGAIDMHMPERWGYVQFSSATAAVPGERVAADPNDPVLWALRRLYYRQRAARTATGLYATSIDALRPSEITAEGAAFRPTLVGTGHAYEITAPAAAGAVAHLTQDGRTWITR
jgi:hypothetical protein